MERVCRICLDGEEDEQLIHPCPCTVKGDAGVHLSCLQKWYLSRGAFANLSCTECKHTLDGPVAVALGEMGLAALEGAEEVDEVELAATLGNLGNAYGTLGKASRKRELLERALAIKERMYGPDHAQVAISLTNLGNAYGDLDDAPKMRELLERALAIHEHNYGAEHAKVASTLVNLGNACGKLGDGERKRALLTRALVIQERTHGPSHAEVAITLRNLALTYRHQQSSQFWLQKSTGSSAKQMLARALAIHERTYGADHRETAITRFNYAVSLKDLGASPEAAQEMARARDGLARSLGGRHPFTAKAAAVLRSWDPDA